MYIMSVQIQCKSGLNKKTDKLKGWEAMEGGKNGQTQSSPTPLLGKNAVS